jgi:Amt family ammonium transporter
MNAIVQGVFILFVTWLFFNGGSGFTIVNRDSRNLPQKIVMNTILSGSMGSITVYIMKGWFFKKMSCPHGYQIIDVCCGLLAGLVSITASCNNVAHWSAIVIGAIGGLVYIWACIFMIKLKIDDPVEASQVHGFCGAWGVLAVGIFDRDGGLVTGSSRLLGVQALGVLMLFLWTTTLSLGYFYMMK